MLEPPRLIKPKMFVPTAPLGEMFCELLPELAAVVPDGGARPELLKILVLMLALLGDVAFPPVVLSEPVALLTLFTFCFERIMLTVVLSMKTLFDWTPLGEFECACLCGFSAMSCS